MKPRLLSKWIISLNPVISDCSYLKQCISWYLVILYKVMNAGWASIICGSRYMWQIKNMDSSLASYSFFPPRKLKDRDTDSIVYCAHTDTNIISVPRLWVCSSSKIYTVCLTRPDREPKKCVCTLSENKAAFLYTFTQEEVKLHSVGFICLGSHYVVIILYFRNYSLKNCSLRMEWETETNHKVFV